MKMKSLFALLVLCFTGFLHAQEKPVVAPQAPDVAAEKFGADGKVNPGFASSHEKFVKIAKEGTAELVFLGDSITAGWGRQQLGVTERNMSFGESKMASWMSSSRKLSSS